jgi:hypothetical protein
MGKTLMLPTDSVIRRKLIGNCKLLNANCIKESIYPFRNQAYVSPKTRFVLP